MLREPRFEYFLSRTNNSVQRDSEVWKASLPLNRMSFGKQPQQANGISVTYGEYFDAVRSFLEKNRFEIVRFAALQQANRDIKPEEIEKVCICLEKHGEFYHPARIETVVSGLKIPFVLNVAISDVGRKHIKTEYNFLQKMNNDFPFSFVPRVYGLGEASTKRRRQISMFLGEWLDGFNEFHISRDPAERKNKIVVWDNKQGNFSLSNDKILELYSQAAMILTSYYNIETFEQLFSWHHAAGDFVLRLQNNKIDLKLITIRQYTSMFEKNLLVENINRDTDLILEALLVFFLNLSIRMRLDRLDGVGDIVWSDDIAVYGFLKGFFDGLALKPRSSHLPAPIDVCFCQHLSFFTEADLYDLAKDIINSYQPKAPEVPVIKQNLKRHIEVLHYTICQV